MVQWFITRYLTDILNMLQPVYVFMIFVLKRNVIDVIQGKDKKRRTKSKASSKSKGNIIKKQKKQTEATNVSNPAFSITFNKDTDTSVVLLSAQPYEDIPLTSPLPKN